MGKLENRVAIVTGAARGMGAATARLFVKEGARVVIVDVLEKEGKTLSRELGDAAIYVPLDVTDETAWSNMVDSTVARWGRIDILINNAAIAAFGCLLDADKKEFQRVLDVNVIGPWLGIKSVSNAMLAQGKGAIVNISSAVGIIGINGLGVYGSSKWALRGLSKIASMELGLKGIRVNAIFPGGVDTPMGNFSGKPAEELDDDFQNQPIQRVGTPEEIAQASLFLVSDDSSYMCGAELTVDGGQTAGVYNTSLPGSPIT